MTSRALIALVVDSDPLFREGLIRILPRNYFRAIGSLACSAELCEASELSPDLVLLGARDTSKAAVDEVVVLHLRWPQARIVVLSNRHDTHDVAAIFRAGASAYLERLGSHNALVKIIELVMAGETVLVTPQLNQIADTDSAQLLPLKQTESMPIQLDSSLDNGVGMQANERSACEIDLGISRLSEREQLILNFLVCGSPNKMIARRLDITESTVKVHMKFILRKIRASNRTQAAIWAAKNGIVMSVDYPQKACQTAASLPLTGGNGGQ